MVGVNRNGVVLVGVLAVIGTVGLMAWNSSLQVHAGALPPAERPQTTKDTVKTPLALPERSPASVVSSPSNEAQAVAMIQSFFGDEADAVRAAIEAKGGDLATIVMPIPEEEFYQVLPRWMTFKDAERVGWLDKFQGLPEIMDNEWVEKRLGLKADLTEDQLLAVESLASLYRPSIDTVGTRYINAVEYAIAGELHRGTVVSSPFISWQGKGSEKRFRAFYTMNRAGQGWSATVELNEYEHAEAFSARKDVNQAIADRNQALREAIRTF